MADDNVVSVRLSETQMAVLDRICQATGWNYSQVFRYLLDNAVIRPAAISVQVDPKAAALAVNGI